MLASTSIFPHFIAYFNPLVGGPKNVYRKVVDSNLDWGQDLKRLKFYMDDKKINKINLSYFGHADPAYYGINNSSFDQADKYIKGYTAISTTKMMSARPYEKNGQKISFDWLKNQKPIDNIGYSILIYNLK